MMSHKVAVALGEACAVEGCFGKPAAFAMVCLGHKIAGHTGTPEPRKPRWMGNLAKDLTGALR